MVVEPRAYVFVHLVKLPLNTFEIHGVAIGRCLHYAFQILEMDLHPFFDSVLELDQLLLDDDWHARVETRIESIVETLTESIVETLVESIVETLPESIVETLVDRVNDFLELRLHRSTTILSSSDDDRNIENSAYAGGVLRVSASAVIDGPQISRMDTDMSSSAPGSARRYDR